MKRVLVVLVLILLILLAGCMGDGQSPTPESDEPSISASSNVSGSQEQGEPSVDNPWNNQTILIAVSDDASSELKEASKQAVEYWNANRQQYSTYTFKFAYTDDQKNSDVIVKPTSYPLSCDYTVSTDTVGCAPLLDADSTVRDQTDVRIVERMPQPAARYTVKHELGHVLGLNHSDKPQSLMSHESNLTDRQQSIIDSADSEELAEKIELEINQHRNEHGLDELQGDDELREEARSRAEELAKKNQSGYVLYTGTGLDLDCRIDIGEYTYLPEGDGDIYTTSLYTFHGIGGLANFSKANYTASPTNAAQQTVSDWQFNVSDPGYAEEYNRHGVGVYIDDSGDYAAVRAIC